MDTLFIPKKFEIQFRRTSEDQYTGALVIDGMQMGVGSPKTLAEITAFLMPESQSVHPETLATNAMHSNSTN